jgi:pimeloyl-ACP methyl ester carboxylesterase
MTIKEIQIQSLDLMLYGKLHFVGKKNPTILFLPGLGFHAFEYEDLTKLMSEAGFNCLSLDYRSHGKSEGRRGYWTLADLVQDAKSAIDYISENINGDIWVFGNSLGATVGVCLASEDDRVRGLIASNCATRPVDFGMNNFRKILLAIASIIFKIVPFRLSVNYFIPYTKILSDKKIIEKIKADKSVSDARRFAVSTYQDMFSWDITKIIPKVKVPILIIQAKKDGLQSITQSTMLFDAANEPKEFQLIETGHVPNLENPEYLSDILVKWFKEKSDK